MRGQQNHLGDNHIEVTSPSGNNKDKLVVGGIDTTTMAKAVEKVVVTKKDVRKELKLLDIAGHVEVEEDDGIDNDTNEDSLVPSSQSLDVEQEENEDQHGVDLVVNMSLQQD